MKVKLFLAFALGILIIVALSFYSRPKAPVPDTREAPADSVENVAPPQKAPPDLIPMATPPIKAQLAQTNSIDERILELSELGLRNDAESYQKIIANLNDADPDIREAALEAIIQFGNRDAIPILKELSEKIEDPVEKMEFLNAAKFLALPSFSEIREQRRTNLNLEARPRPTN